MAIPQYPEIIGPFLGLLNEHTQMNLDDIVKKLRMTFQLSDDEFRQMLKSGNDNVFRNRIRWARLSLVKAGCIVNSKRAVYLITERGRTTYLFYKDATTTHHLMRFDEYREWIEKSNRKNRTDTKSVQISNEDDVFSGQLSIEDLLKGKETLPEPNPPVSKTVQKIESEEKLQTAAKEFSSHNTEMSFFSDTLVETPEEAMARHIEFHDSALKNEILEMVKNMNPKKFELLVKKLIIALGYGDNFNLGRSHGGRGDGGIDGEVWKDKLGLDKVYFQAKRYSDKAITTDDIRSFRGALIDHGGKKGIFVTTSRFTKDASKSEHSPSGLDIKIVLIDGDALARLMIEYGLGVSVKTTYQLKAIDQDFFES